MKFKEKLANTFAERNSSPGIQGRDELYDILIQVQKDAYLAGFEAAREMAADVLTREMKQPKGLSGILARSIIEQLGEEEVSTYNIESPWEKMR